MKKEILIRRFIQKVWNEKDFDSITNYVAPAYSVYKDPSDPWEGRTLNREEFAMRLDYTFDSFPDIRFEILTESAAENSVAITWLMTGTNNGKNGIFPPTGKSIRTVGATTYYFNNGKVCGHSQVFDRATVIKQLGYSNDFK
jgi:steroid delta-isomerase-like uncharacterized protein